MLKQIPAAFERGLGSPGFCAKLAEIFRVLCDCNASEAVPSALVSFLLFEPTQGSKPQAQNEEVFRKKMGICTKTWAMLVFSRLTCYPLCCPRQKAQILPSPIARPIASPLFCKGQKKKKEPGVSTGVEKSVHAFGE